MSAENSPEQPAFFDGPNGRLAYRETTHGAADRATIVWLGGFRSDMDGTKAAHLHQWAQDNGHGYLRFDYSGHGLSDGVFADGAISDWASDARAIVHARCAGKTILVGSSMGAWIALLLARAAPEKLAGLVLLAPAPDFTSALMWPSLTDAERAAIERDGRLEKPSDYDETPTILTRRLFEDGAKSRVLDQPISIPAPVRILQGMADLDVPYGHALKTAETIRADDLVLTLTKSGDHRLSTDQDLARLTATLEGIIN